MLKLNGKLFRFTREGAYIYDIQNKFFKIADILNPFPSAFQELCSGFSIFLVIFQNYRLMKIRSTNSNGEFRVPADIKDGVLCHDTIAKSSVLDVPGVTSYIMVIICFWLQCRCTSLMT